MAKVQVTLLPGVKDGDHQGLHAWWSALSSTKFDWWCSVNLALEPWDSHQMWTKQASLISKVPQRYRVLSKRWSLQVLLRIRAIMFPWTKPASFPHFPRLWGSLQGCNHQGACREGLLTLRVNAATSVSLSQLIWLDRKCVEVQALMAGWKALGTYSAISCCYCY